MWIWRGGSKDSRQVRIFLVKCPNALSKVPVPWTAILKNIQAGFASFAMMFKLCTNSTPMFSISHKHDDVIKRKHFPCHWPFVRGIHRSPVNPPHKGQWRGALMFSLICARRKGWLNNRDAGDLRRHCDHYDVTVRKYARVFCCVCFVGVVSWYIIFLSICTWFINPYSSGLFRWHWDNRMIVLVSVKQHMKLKVTSCMW